jgi:hypothetical protein
MLIVLQSAGRIGKRKEELKLCFLGSGFVLKVKKSLNSMYSGLLLLPAVLQSAG